RVELSPRYIHPRGLLDTFGACELDLPLLIDSEIRRASICARVSRSNLVLLFARRDLHVVASVLCCTRAAKPAWDERSLEEYFRCAFAVGARSRHGAPHERAEYSIRINRWFGYDSQLRSFRLADQQTAESCTSGFRCFPGALFPAFSGPLAEQSVSPRF